MTEVSSAGQDELLLPDGACLLHIGPYKTGSTAIQVAMWQARETMREHGVAYPGRWRRAMRPGWAVLNYTPRGRKPVPIEVWEEFAREVRERREPRCCVSTEDFGSAGPAYARRIVEDLGGDSVHVVAVARRLDRLLPSQWQERVKSHDTYTYDQWLRMVLGEDERNREWRRFWASHDVARMFDRWEPAVGRDRFFLVASDDTDRDLVPRTFEGMLGLPSGVLSLPPGSNASLSANGVELIRRLNESFVEQGWPDTTYHKLVQRGAILSMIESPRAPGEERIPPLPRWAAERAEELSARRVQEIRDRGIRVIGDVDCLRTPAADPAAPERPEAPQVISLESSVQAMAGVVEAAVEEFARTDARVRRRAQRRDQRRAQRRDRHRDPRRGGRGTARTAGPRAPEDLPVAEVPTSRLLRVVAGRAARRLRPGGTD